MNPRMIKAAQDGDKEAINQLCIDLYSPLKEICAKKLTAKFDYSRDDALHDSLIVILEKIREFENQSDGDFLKWCSNITSKCCRRHAKPNKVITSLPTEELPEKVAPEYIESSLGCEDIAEAISQLSPGARNNANLFFIEGHDHEEIAEILGIKVSTSTSGISRIRPVLQNWLTKLGLYDK